MLKKIHSTLQYQQMFEIYWLHCKIVNNLEKHLKIEIDDEKHVLEDLSLFYDQEIEAYTPDLMSMLPDVDEVYVETTKLQFQLQYYTLDGEHIEQKTYTYNSDIAEQILNTIHEKFPRLKLYKEERKSLEAFKNIDNRVVKEDVTYLRELFKKKETYNAQQEEDRIFTLENPKITIADVEYEILAIDDYQTMHMNKNVICITTLYKDEQEHKFYKRNSILAKLIYNAIVKALD